MDTAKLQAELTRRLAQTEPGDSAALHRAVAETVMDAIAPIWARSRQQHAAGRRAYYLSAEFLVGRAVYNNLLCAGLTQPVEAALQAAGTDLSALEDLEDAALGNGGLGRLAACYLDSAATRGLPLDGYGIRYRYGLFRQRFRDGFQQELPDNWTRDGDPWSIRQAKERVRVSFGSGDVWAVPYDMPILGYGAAHAATLRLWQCEPLEPFDLAAFNEQDYDRAVAAKNRAEDISRVLYPNDSGRKGKVLRLKQQYFFTAASLQDLLRTFARTHGERWEQLADNTAIQLNDTHPVIAIPELIRLLTERGVPFIGALDIARRVFNYTNHTVMPEALETWDMAIVEEVCPAIVPVVQQLAAQQEQELTAAGVPKLRWKSLQLLQGDTLHMAYLACWVAAHINGVAQLHTDILKQTVLSEFHRLYPEKLVNVTNGVTQRRWLGLCDPGLAAFITRQLGDEGWLTDLSRLGALAPLAQEDAAMEQFLAIKRENQRRLAAYVRRREGVELLPEALYDVQIKRLHEYKRQLLNALCILEQYFRLREGQLPAQQPTVFLFGAKAAPGYQRAKAIIKLIHEIAALIARDPAASRLMQVVFVTDYNVSYAEKIIPAADVSVQISTAGTEASGTGNMKLMLNGAGTMGTYDGANIEIVRAAGEENNYIFGARVEDIRRLETSYTPRRLYESDPSIRRCLDAFTDGTLDDGGTGWFRELKDSLLEGADWHRPDAYFLLADFEDCLSTRLRLQQDQREDPLAFARKQWRNVCAAGYFSSDRAIEEYAREIWQIARSESRAARR